MPISSIEIECPRMTFVVGGDITNIQAGKQRFPGNRGSPVSPYDKTGSYFLLFIEPLDF